MQLLSAINSLVLLGFSLSLLGSAPATAAYDPPPVQQGRTLDDCTEKLTGQGGGWCEIRQSDEHPSISSVWPQNLDPRIQMVVGPRAVLTAWNGAAFDAKNNLLYFMGGGHADYGGNEVYEFDLTRGRWSRLTDPSPADHLYIQSPGKPDSKYCWAPDMRKVPGSSHTYDGLEFVEATGTIVFVMYGHANGACFADSAIAPDDPRILPYVLRGRGIFEFNPSRDEERHGLAPLAWRRIYTPNDADKVGLSYPRVANTPNNSLLIGDRHRMYQFDVTSRRFGGVGLGNADYGDGLTILHPTTGTYYTNSGKFLISHGEGNQAYEIPAPSGKSMAVDSRGVIFMWSGTSTIVTFNPKTAKWAVFDWAAAGPRDGNGRVYSKWQYVPSHDVFVGLSIHTTGVWIYKHPTDMPDLAMSETNPQQYIDLAPLDSTVTIPPGRYNWGLTINKPLTVNLKDVHLWGVANRKGIINVNCDDCSVVIEDFHAEGRRAGCLGGNCAGIKAEGVNFDLTVRRAEIDNTVMGILTDNRGGRLVIEDSLIKNTGLDDRSRTLGHGVYAGDIDELIVRRSSIQNVNGNGHILKSRAPFTLLENVRLLGEKGYHSRSIDFPCGGELQISSSVIQHGENTDNPDIISIGTEAQNCGGTQPSRVSMVDNWVIVDRDRSADERARDYGPNFLFRWRAPMESITLKNNHIVNMDAWSTAQTEKGDVVLPNLAEHNRMCRNRAECGLEEGALPAP